MASQYLPRELCIMNGFWVGTALTTHQVFALCIDEVSAMVDDDHEALIAATRILESAARWDATLTPTGRANFYRWVRKNIDHPYSPSVDRV